MLNFSRAPGRTSVRGGGVCAPSESRVHVGREEGNEVRTAGTLMDQITQYAAPIAGVAAGLTAGVLLLGGRLGMTLGLGVAGGVVGYFVSRPAGSMT